MTDFQISFFDCAHVLRVKGISVTSTGATAYTYVENVARTLKRWITVTAREFCRAVVQCAQNYVRHIVRNTGSEILRKSAILRL